jgi:hypothetical protein
MLVSGLHAWKIIHVVDEDSLDRHLLLRYRVVHLHPIEQQIPDVKCHLLQENLCFCTRQVGSGVSKKALKLKKHIWV